MLYSYHAQLQMSFEKFTTYSKLPRKQTKIQYAYVGSTAITAILIESSHTRVSGCRIIVTCAIFVKHVFINFVAFIVNLG